jgi:nucleosome binding factor SPN SPT16 subunit
MMLTVVLLFCLVGLLDKQRPNSLSDVMIKPNLDGKRVAGDIQIHENGIRYATHSGQKVGQYAASLPTLFSFCLALVVYGK